MEGMASRFTRKSDTTSFGFIDPVCDGIEYSPSEKSELILRKDQYVPIERKKTQKLSLGNEEAILTFKGSAHGREKIPRMA